MLQEGITYAHEHVTIDLSGVKKDVDACMDCQQATIDEFCYLRSLGVANIIDVTNRGMGRNILYTRTVAEQSGVNIISSTGYYKEPFLPQEVYDLNEQKLAKILIKEIQEGIDGTNVKAEVIGEVGTSQFKIEPMERKVLGAAARAHQETGKPIITHTTLGQLGLEQITVFREYGVDLGKVIIGHVDLSGDAEYVLRLLDAGASVAFDTVGKVNYMSEERRLAMLTAICEQGYADKVVLSMDLTRRSHLKSHNGIGYAYLLETFIPFIRDHGINECDITTMLQYSLRKIFQ
jgi:phosphotriesterase-related protein